MSVHANTSCPVTPGKLTPSLSLADLGSGAHKGRGTMECVLMPSLNKARGLWSTLLTAGTHGYRMPGFLIRRRNTLKLTVLMVAFSRDYTYSIKCISTHNGLIRM